MKMQEMEKSVSIMKDGTMLCRHLGILLDLAKKRESFTPVLMPKWVYDKLTEVFDLSEETELGRRAKDGEGNPFALRLLKGEASAVLKKTGKVKDAKCQELSIMLLRDSSEFEKRVQLLDDNASRLKEEIDRLKAGKVPVKGTIAPARGNS